MSAANDQNLYQINLSGLAADVERDVRRTGVAFATDEAIRARARVEALQRLLAGPLPLQPATSIADRMLFHTLVLTQLAVAKARYAIEVAKKALGSARDAHAKLARPKPFVWTLLLILGVLVGTLLVGYFAVEATDDAVIAMEVSNLKHLAYKKAEIVEFSRVDGAAMTRALVAGMYLLATMTVLSAASFGHKIATLVGEVLIAGTLAFFRVRMSKDLEVGLGFGSMDLGVGLLHLAATSWVGKKLVARHRLQEDLNGAKRIVEERKADLTAAEGEHKLQREKEDTLTKNLVSREEGARRQQRLAAVVHEKSIQVERDVRTAMLAEALHDPTIDIFRETLGLTKPEPESR